MEDLSSGLGDRCRYPTERMKDEEHNRRVYSLKLGLLLTFVIAALLALPQLLSGADVSLVAVFWIVTIHKTLLFSACTCMVYLALGRNLVAGAVLVLFLLCACLPDFMISVEYTFTESIYKTLDLLDYVGLAEPFRQADNYLYSLFGFDFPL